MGGNFDFFFMKNVSTLLRYNESSKEIQGEENSGIIQYDKK